MNEFLRRHLPAVALAFVGVLVVALLSGIFTPFQIGIGPEFLLKAFAKLLYVAEAIILTHVILRLIFPTVYCYTYTKAGEEKSDFMLDWAKGGPKTFNPKMYIAVAVHLGVFASICLILSLAF